MTDVPVEVIVAAFQDQNGASAALEQLKQAKKEGLIQIEDAAVLVKNADGKLSIKETADMGGGKGAVIGGVLGGVVGILAGPIGWAALGGAVIGGLAAKMRDGGFPDARLRQIGESLKPGSSAIIAVIDHTWVLEVERRMQQAGADTVTAAVSADIAKQLEAGKDVAYSAVGTAAGLPFCSGCSVCAKSGVVPKAKATERTRFVAVRITSTPRRPCRQRRPRRPCCGPSLPASPPGRPGR